MQRPWDTQPVSFRKSISRLLAIDGMTPGDRERAENYDEWKKKTLQLEKYAAASEMNERYTARPSLAKRWSRTFSVDGKTRGDRLRDAQSMEAEYLTLQREHEMELKKEAERKDRATGAKKVAPFKLLGLILAAVFVANSLQGKKRTHEETSYSGSSNSKVYYYPPAAPKNNVFGFFQGVKLPFRN